jgi:hypothetical protein
MNCFVDSKRVIGRALSDKFPNDDCKTPNVDLETLMFNGNHGQPNNYNDIGSRGSLIGVSCFFAK